MYPIAVSFQCLLGVSCLLELVSSIERDVSISERDSSLF